jgi:hypothetical protein
MDSRSAPANVHLSHFDYPLANFDGNTLPAWTTLSGLPSPEKSEALTMPSQDCGWLHHGQTVGPAFPGAGEQHPEGTVNRSRSAPRFSVNEARELVAQGRILGDEICAILDNGSDNREDQWELERHLAKTSLSPNEREKSVDPQL